MTFSEWKLLPESEKIVLFEIDTAEAVPFWFCYEAGIWAYNVKSGKYNVTATFQDGSFCYGPFQEADTGNYGDNYITKQVKSFTVDATQYTEVTTMANLRSTNQSFYYAGEIIYVHFDGFATPYGFTTIQMGITTGFSNKDIYLNDNFYQGKIISLPAITITWDDWYFSQRKYSGGNVQLINNDGYFDTFIDQTIYGQECRIILGGTEIAYSEYKTLYTGYMKSFTTTIEVFSIVIGDQKDKIGRTLPISYFDTITYPNINDDNANKPIPIAYGYIRNAPVVCTNEDEAGPPANYNFKLCDTTYHSVVDSAPTVKVNGTAKAILNWDASTATFDIANANYTPGDEVTATFQGYDDSTGKDGSGSLIEDGLDVISDIMENFCAITYNSDNFDTTEWESHTSYDVQIFIDKHVKVSEIIDQISRGELGVLVVEGAGLWTFKKINDGAAKSIEIWEDEIFPGMSREDNGAVYLTSATVKYNENYDKEKYHEYTDNTEESTIYAEYGVYKNKEFITYLDDAADAESLAGDIMDEYGEIVPIFSIKTTIKAAELELFDTAVIHFDRMNNEWLSTIKCRVISITYNLNSPMNIDLKCKYIEDWERVNAVYEMKWTSDTETFPAALGGATISAWDDTWTTQQKIYAKRNWGFYAEDSELISLTDPDSQGQDWGAD